MAFTQLNGYCDLCMVDYDLQKGDKNVIFITPYPETMDGCFACDDCLISLREQLKDACRGL